MPTLLDSGCLGSGLHSGLGFWASSSDRRLVYARVLNSGGSHTSIRGLWLSVKTDIVLVSRDFVQLASASDDYIDCGCSLSLPL